MQASTRCLRQVKENKERAKIYLSSKNIEILDKELQENFNISIEDFKNQDNQKILTKNVEIRKYKMPKLSELYAFLYNDDYDKFHSADGDVLALLKCLKKI